ncbi:MAG: protein translocase subunit SecD [Patescibacteria group bacterium]|nr:MAG: protein translocase subunit SecD [Patescibacteria group bacterium]
MKISRLLKFIVVSFIIIFLIWLNLKPRTLSFNLFGKKINKEFKMFYGLDLQGGTELIFEADTSNITQEDKKSALEASKSIIEQRINYLGVAEPSVVVVKSQNSYRIQTALPGITDPKRAVELIGNTAQLSFREVQISTPSAQTASESAQTATGSAELTFSNPTDLTGKDIKKAQVQFDPQTGKPIVELIFTEEGSKKFEKITEKNVGKPLAIFIDEFLLSMPIVQQKISGPSAVISGNFNLETAKDLALKINSGALPVSLKLVKQQKIPPTLGKEEIQKSMIAGSIGLLSVALFMLIIYGRFGVVAIISLILYGIISITIFKLIPVVLTLSGLAGFILSIGMAVDSNILISERIKEELRKGKDPKIAFNLGFGRALDTIKDANFTTLAVALLLFNPLNWEFLPQFGLIKGFALTLGIGVVISLFTGVFITKRILQILFKYD